MKAILSALAVLAVTVPAAASAQDRGGRHDGRNYEQRGRQDGQRHDQHGRHDYDNRDDRGDERRAYGDGYREGRQDQRQRYGQQSYRPGYAPPRYYAPPPRVYVQPRPYYGQGYYQAPRARWYRGQVLPYEYRRYPVYDYGQYGWGPPPRGYSYYRTNTGEILLAAIATGVILSVIGGGF